MSDWSYYIGECIGTFNYKKSVLGRDYDTIIKAPNQTIESVLDGHYGAEEVVNDDPALSLFPIDSSQYKAIAYAGTGKHMVIQGPPGTGKSHTIAACIQHQLYLGKKVLFVSEKKSALDVVYDRLGDVKPLVGLPCTRS